MAFKCVCVCKYFKDLLNLFTFPDMSTWSMWPSIFLSMIKACLKRNFYSRASRQSCINHLHVSIYQHYYISSSTNYSKIITWYFQEHWSPPDSVVAGSIGEEQADSSPPCIICLSFNFHLTWIQQLMNRIFDWSPWKVFQTGDQRYQKKSLLSEPRRVNTMYWIHVQTLWKIVLLFLWNLFKQV